MIKYWCVWWRNAYCLSSGLTTPAKAVSMIVEYCIQEFGKTFCMVKLVLDYRRKWYKTTGRGHMSSILHFHIHDFSCVFRCIQRISGTKKSIMFFSLSTSIRCINLNPLRKWAPDSCTTFCYHFFTPWRSFMPPCTLAKSCHRILK